MEQDRVTDRSRRVKNLTSALKPAGQWLLLIAIAAYLLTWVDPGASESPYNGF